MALVALAGAMLYEEISRNGVYKGACGAHLPMVVLLLLHLALRAFGLRFREKLPYLRRDSDPCLTRLL